MFDSSKLYNNFSPYPSWKGQTFGQITSSIQRNSNATLSEQKNYSQPTVLAFLPPPLKIYRREAFTKPLKTESSKQSTSIELLERPGSSLVVFDNTKGWNVCDNDCSGNKLTLDTNLINNRGERGLCCDTTIAEQLNPASVARRRCRSAGMYKKKNGVLQPPSSQTKAPYANTTKEYLSTRGKTFNQNQYHYLKSGNALARPGAPGSQNNKYSINDGGSFYCDASGYYIQSEFKPSNYKFSQDGGVSSSARTNRLNYNTITTNGGLYTKAYGSQVGNALSYGKSSDAYTIKDKIGVPAPCDISCKTTKLKA
jgi:hypothetical protein